MSVIGSGMADQSGGAGSISTGPGVMVDVSNRPSVSGASGAGQSGGAGGGLGTPEGTVRRMSIFGSMSEQGPAPEPLFVAPEHKEVIISLTMYIILHHKTNVCILIPL